MAYTTIKKPSDYFNTVLYTGNYSTQSITGVNFQPDLVWIKSRSSAESHVLTDVIRGTGGNLYTNANSAEDTGVTTGVTSFDSDGFSLGANNGFNSSGNTFASWNWKANGTGVSNTDGSITSTVSANTTSGFSIVSWTGTGSALTVGHGLGETPKMIIVKNRSSSLTTWQVYHHKLSSTPETSYIYLQLTQGARHNYPGFWNSTAPTSSFFNIGTDGDVNTSGENMIAYCFAEKKGFSKFGSYTGNGSTDGTFIYTGFKPAFVIQKQSSADGESWMMKDNKRETGNQTDANLYPNATNVEGDTNGIDLLSNGFKCRTSSAGSNTSGATYIYIAFAEEPLVGDNPATAR
jgi:hypothetical protein